MNHEPLITNAEIARMIARAQAYAADCAREGNFAAATRAQLAANKPRELLTEATEEGRPS